MKLWYSNSSPYARKARAVVQYHQLQDRVELLLTTSGLDKNSPHNLDNPLGRLPALQREMVSGFIIVHSLLNISITLVLNLHFMGTKRHVGKFSVYII